MRPPKAPPLRPNPHVARKLFGLPRAAEMAYRLRGIQHADFLRGQASRQLGQTRRELRRIVALGPDAGRLVDFFLREFDV